MNLPEQLAAWRSRHKVTEAAFYDLWRLLTAPVGGVGVGLEGMSENATQQRIRLESPDMDAHLWRNNVGALLDKRGVPVRYGLCNDSKKMNDRVKSSDLIGITRRIIGPDDVGRTFGIFTAVECKAGSWTFKGTAHEQAQQRFHTIVRSSGGFAGFARTPEDVRTIIK